jgi:photosystem II stability/assembly factor-like uncharacterized protein
MSRLQFAARVATTVLATLAVAGVAYGGATGLPHRTAAVPHPLPASTVSPIAQPTPMPTKSPAGPFAIDQDMLDASTGWMLVSDCPLRANPTCHNSVTKTADGGQTWTRPIQVGPSFPVTDGDAPRTIRFLNRTDGFVYGHNSAFVTHDGGGTWARFGLLATFVSSITTFGDTVWAVTYPCAKGTQCPYEVRSSLDGARTWSPAHQLPADYSPLETAVAFGSGLVLSSVPLGDIEMTADRGKTWSFIKSACPANPFRGYATTSDGKDLWELCSGYPDSTGQTTGTLLFVSANGGKSWSRRDTTKLGPLAWLVSNRPHVAFANIDHATLVSRDGGVAWASLIQVNVDFAFIRFDENGGGWALDAQRGLWVTTDGGAGWNEVGQLPSRLS